MERLDGSHELLVRLRMLGALSEWDRLATRHCAPCVEPGGPWRQAVARAARGETREDTVACLEATVRAAEEAAGRGAPVGMPSWAADTAAAAGGIDRLCGTTYADDARTSAALALLADRLRMLARGDEAV